MNYPRSTKVVIISNMEDEYMTIQKMLYQNNK